MDDTAETASSNIQDSERLAELERVLGVIKPVIEQDGGELRLIACDAETGDIVLELAGACGSCAVSAVTLEQGVERILRQRLPWVTRVTGRVEESNTDGYGGWVPKTTT